MFNEPPLNWVVKAEPREMLIPALSRTMAPVGATRALTEDEPMADTEVVVARFIRLLDQVAAESAASLKSTTIVVRPCPAPTSYEVVLGRLTSRLDENERAELIGLFDKMSHA